MKILITGGAGFIGSQLGLYLIKKKHTIIPLDNLQYGYIRNFSNNKQLLKNFVKMDIRDSKLKDSMKGVDVVFHFAGIVAPPACNNDPFEAYSCNVLGTVHVLEMARHAGVKKIVFASTSALYENEENPPFSESKVPFPTLIYPQTKRAGEELCRSYSEMYGMDITILRFFNVYGPHMDFRPPSFLMSYIIGSLLKKEQPVLHSNGKQARDFVYVDDVVKMCEIAMTHPLAKNDMFNVGTGKTVTIRQIFDIIAHLVGEKKIVPIFRDPKLIWEKFHEQFEGSYPMNRLLIEREVNKYTRADTKKSKKILGWEAKVDIQEGLKRTVEDFKKRIGKNGISE